MQHILHLFIGDELARMRSQFAALFKNIHPEITSPYLTILSLVKGENGKIQIQSDDPLDSIEIDSREWKVSYYNYFESLFGRKVTVATPGNNSLVVMVWTKLFVPGYEIIIESLIEGISSCTSNISVELNGFTQDSVTAFISNPAELEAPGVYRSRFEKNMSVLLPLRPSLGAFRLLANRNLNNIALGFNEDSYTRVCVEFSALMSHHYLTFKSTFVNSAATPFESFGISAIKFDRNYYHQYLLNKVIIDGAEAQKIENRRLNVNALAQSTNPVLQKFQDTLRNFYQVQVANARSQLAVNSSVSESNIVGQVDPEFQHSVSEFRKAIKELIDQKDITVYERQALLSLILGEDCALFDTSAVRAHEIVLDDILDDSVAYFQKLDKSERILQKVSWQKLRRLKNEMRNIAVVNRQRQQQLNEIAAIHKIKKKGEQHIADGKYNFDGVEYHLNLTIDSEPLAEEYKPSAITKTTVDLRPRFAPVRDQKQQGSCAAFALSSVIESMIGHGTFYSPAFLYWNARLLQHTEDDDSGASIYSVVKAAMEKGDCIEDYMPYNPQIFNVRPSETAVEAAAECKVIGAKTVSPSVVAIKSALCEGFPVIIGARIFNSFSETVGGFVCQPSKRDLELATRDDCHDMHAMVVCGFSDAEKVFVVRNSWGTNFGDNGYCYIPYLYAEKYFIQACIISGITAQQTTKPVQEIATTLQFNRNDASISYAILQNIIHEDNEELARKKEEYNTLKSIWTRNLAEIGNVNNQEVLVDEEKERIVAEMDEMRRKHRELQQTKDQKLKDFSKESIKGIIYVGIFWLINVILMIRWPNWYTFIWTGILTVLLLFLISKFTWQRKLYKQKLLDEIKLVADKIEKRKGLLRQVGVQAHIHSEILKAVGDVKNELIKTNEKLVLFNEALLSLYKTTKRDLAAMTPIVPYPFIAVIQNETLNSYYNHWRDRMVSALDINSMLGGYTGENGLREEFETNVALNEQICRGLKGFSMSQYLARTDPGKWQFLPTNNISTVLQDLDRRATPFCPYSQEVNTPWAKYLFVKGLTAADQSNIRPWFQHPPMCVDAYDTDSIYILSIARYKLE